MHILEVSMNTLSNMMTSLYKYILSKQLAGYSGMLSLVLVLVPSFWMMSSAAQVLASYLSAPVGQSCPMTAFTLMMLVLGVKVTHTML